MPKTLLVVLSFTILTFSASFSKAQDRYRWPMDIEHGLTSTFCEYRGGHFHAGVDLKTWGRTGIPVHAAESGYIYRIRTSPWGYGRAVYLKLEDGNLAIYAHLSKFAPEMEKVIKAKHREKGWYTIDFYPEEGEFPVVKGQIIGSSGRSGTKFPHLHFELRDPDNRPINPLADHIVSIKDSKPPVLVKISLSPIGPDSYVNSSHTPYMLNLHKDKQKKIFINDEIPHLEGTVGLGISSYDIADVARNKLSPYRYELYLDDSLLFRSEYNTFSYEKTHKIELNSDFGLNRKGLGHFQNLFVAPGNDLPFYKDHKTGDGLLTSESLLAGIHHITVKVFDVYDNTSYARFRVIVGEKPQIDSVEVKRVTDRTDYVHLSLQISDRDSELSELMVETSYDRGENWESLLRKALSGKTYQVSDSLKIKRKSPVILKISVLDAHGIGSEPRFFVLPPKEIKRGWPPLFSCDQIGYPDFIELRIVSSDILSGLPSVTLLSKAKRLRIRQRDIRTYEAVIPFQIGQEGISTVCIEGTSLSGEKGSYRTVISYSYIGRHTGGKIESYDGKAVVVFDPGSVYDVLYPRVGLFDTDSPSPIGSIGDQSGVDPEVPGGLQLIGTGYAFEPYDVPFDRKARISLSYPEDFPNPETLGVYFQDTEWASRPERGWKFIDNNLNADARTVSADISYFSRYALLSDQIPPDIHIVYPRDGAVIKDLNPQLRARIQDKGSGIKREQDIEMRLDGSLVICQYDPPEESVFYRVEDSLSSGEHTLELWVSDMSGNKAYARSRFKIR